MTFLRFFLKKGVRVNGLCCAELRNGEARTLFHIASSNVWWCLTSLAGSRQRKGMVTWRGRSGMLRSCVGANLWLLAWKLSSGWNSNPVAIDPAAEFDGGDHRVSFRSRDCSSKRTVPPQVPLSFAHRVYVVVWRRGCLDMIESDRLRVNARSAVAGLLRPGHWPRVCF